MTAPTSSDLPALWISSPGHPEIPVLPQEVEAIPFLKRIAEVGFSETLSKRVSFLEPLITREWSHIKFFVANGSCDAEELEQLCSLARISDFLCFSAMVDAVDSAIAARLTEQISVAQAMDVLRLSKLCRVPLSERGIHSWLTSNLLNGTIDEASWAALAAETSCLDLSTEAASRQLIQEAGKRFPAIQSLTISHPQVVADPNLLEELCKHFPRLEKLSIENARDLESAMLSGIAALPSLKTLSLGQAWCLESMADLSPLCQSNTLEKLQLPRSPFLKGDVLEEHLENQSGKAISITSA